MGPEGAEFIKHIPVFKKNHSITAINAWNFHKAMFFTYSPRFSQAPSLNKENVKVSFFYGYKWLEFSKNNAYNLKSLLFSGTMVWIKKD